MLLSNDFYCGNPVLLNNVFDSLQNDCVNFLHAFQQDDNMFFINQLPAIFHRFPQTYYNELFVSLS